MVGLRHVRRSDALNHELHTELILIQDVCTDTMREGSLDLKKDLETEAVTDSLNS